MLSRRVCERVLSIECQDSADNCPRTNCPFFEARRWRRYAVFEALMPLAPALQRLSRKPHSLIERRTAMKFETLMLNSLFIACAAICVSTLASRLA